MEFKSHSKIRICHIITGLNIGGAETMLYKLLSAMNRDIFHNEVISLTDIGPIGQNLKSINIPVTALLMQGPIPNPMSIIKLARLILSKKYHVIQTWMYHADLVGGLIAKLISNTPVIWNIRHSTLNNTKKITYYITKFCAHISNIVPNEIISCSQTAMVEHYKIGYCKEKLRYIPNGFDIGKFRQDIKLNREVRQELNIPENTVVVGSVARYHPDKDHKNLIEASLKVLEYHPEVRFVLCGRGVTWDNDELVSLIRNSASSGNFTLIGERNDVHRLTNAFDIAVSSSSTEGFSNTIGEAMACGVPCVVTNVGDSALIVGEAGIVVPPQDSAALAKGIIDLLEIGGSERRKLGVLASERILDNFSLSAIVKTYETVYLKASATERHLRRF